MVSLKLLAYSRLLRAWRNSLTLESDEVVDDPRVPKRKTVVAAIIEDASYNEKKLVIIKVPYFAELILLSSVFAFADLFREEK